MSSGPLVSRGSWRVHAFGTWAATAPIGRIVPTRRTDRTTATLAALRTWSSGSGHWVPVRESLETVGGRSGARIWSLPAQGGGRVQSADLAQEARRDVHRGVPAPLAGEPRADRPGRLR